MRVALVHDDLVQWGGAEKVLTALAEIFPQAPIYTSVFDAQNQFLRKEFASKTIITSFLQKIPGWRNFYKALLPLYPIAFEQFDFSGFDLVISHSTRFAKSIITKPKTYHLCYCPTPPRFLWNFSKDREAGIFQPFLSYLRIYDQVAGKRVDQWVANSWNVQARIKKVYRAESTVIYPFVDLAKYQNLQPFEGGYLLVISRLNRYKRVDLAIQAANNLNWPLKIIGAGPQKDNLEKIAGPKVSFLGSLEEDLLLEVIAGCKALVVAGEEDFGMTALEAQAAGKPVIAFARGGALETVIEKETGYFFEEQNSESLILALKKLEKYGYNKKACQAQAQKFSKTNFMRQFQRLVSSIPST